MLAAGDDGRREPSRLASQKAAPLISRAMIGPAIGQGTSLAGDG
jgi:hypothetical protein